MINASSLSSSSSLDRYHEQHQHRYNQHHHYYYCRRDYHKKNYKFLIIVFHLSQLQYLLSSHLSLNIIIIENHIDRHHNQ